MDGTALGVLLAALCTWPGAAILHTHQKLESAIPTDKCSWELQLKDIDILIYGSTGYMGSRIAEHFLKLGGDLRVGIAARNTGKLHAQLNGLKRGGLHPASLTSVSVGALGNATALLSMAQRARIIVSAAGPYQRLGGEALVVQAMRACAHYIDISIEAVWRAGVLRAYDEAAKRRGLVIVQGAGFVSTATDIIALHVAKSMEADGSGPPDEVYVSVTKMNGLPTGGALASIPKEDADVKDPYLLAPEATEAQRVDATLEGHKSYGHNDDLKKKVYFYPGARVEPLLLRRTMVAEYPDHPVSVKLAATDDLFSNLLQFYKDTTSKRGRQSVSTPKPGEGPPQWLIEDGSFALEAVAMRKQPPKRTRVILRGTHDPGVTGTVQFTSTLALTLLENGPYRGEVGYLTPARVVDPGPFIQRLRRIMLAGNVRWLHIAHGFEKGDQGVQGVAKGDPGGVGMKVPPGEEELEPVPEEEVPVLRAYQQERLAASVRSMEGMPFDILDELMPQPGGEDGGDRGEGVGPA